METPKVALRLRKNIVQELRNAAHRESLKQGRTVSWVELLHLAAEKYLRHYTANREVVSGNQ